MQLSLGALLVELGCRAACRGDQTNTAWLPRSGFLGVVSDTIVSCPGWAMVSKVRSLQIPEEIWTRLRHFGPR